MNNTSRLELRRGCRPDRARRSSAGPVVLCSLLPSSSARNARQARLASPAAREQQVIGGSPRAGAAWIAYAQIVDDLLWPTNSARRCGRRSFSKLDLRRSVGGPNSAADARRAVLAA